jgi:hypothetical protein
LDSLGNKDEGLRQLTHMCSIPYSNRKEFFRWVGNLLCLGLFLLMLASCAMTHSGSQSNARIKSLQLETTAASRLLPPELIQAQVMRFADVYSVQIAEAADNFSAKVKTSGAREAALRWKLGQSTSAYIDATGPNPYLNGLDMLVLVTLSRMVIENYGIKVYGDAARPLLEVQRKMETNVWMLAGGILKPAQQQELRDLILEWHQKNPDQRSVGAIRFQEFAVSLGRSPKPSNTAPTSIFSLLFLDPMAGLDSTTAALHETRLWGDRAMYYTQRMPALLNWQAELLTYQLAAQPESQQVLSNVASLSASAASFSKTADQLPAIINEQRQAAIQQVLDTFATQEVKARGLLSEAQQTLSVGNDMAVSVNRAINSLDELILHISSSHTNHVSTTNAASFDVLDYGRAASQIGAAADKVKALLISFNDSESQWRQLNEEASASAERLARNVFWRGVMLILIFLLGSVLARLGYQILITRLTRRGTKFSTREP